ncbi:rhodanese-like domain-containing protein [Pacificoceanicola onchidii]|uniref:rhodanese-like domain-containing protein n=1 Tax=Pacificoceanicola onchidii TaxID=2562685 RepID=UPI0014561481|nr:rhodanese-like domain-containing protein [Pacificoceanicola onchidii]
MLNVFKGLAVCLVTLLPCAASAAEEAPFTVGGTTVVDTDQAMTLFEEEAHFFDARKPSDFEAGRVPGAVNFFAKQTDSADMVLEVARKEDVIVVYCNGPRCLMSAVLAENLVAWGFTEVRYYRDGFPAWYNAGYPIE